MLDATDTTAFCELPSGNYLTGQGGGELVLWDSANVKLIYRKCHSGKIEYLMLDNTGLFFQADNLEPGLFATVQKDGKRPDPQQVDANPLKAAVLSHSNG